MKCNLIIWNIKKKYILFGYLEIGFIIFFFLSGIFLEYILYDEFLRLF